MEEVLDEILLKDEDVDDIQGRIYLDYFEGQLSEYDLMRLWASLWFEGLA